MSSLFHVPLERRVAIRAILSVIARPLLGNASDLLPSGAVRDHVDQLETGIASWYGYPYHGRHAANGEIYDMEKMTAAHRTLPFNSRLRVVNLSNDKTVEVRINDRGPFVDGRVIDLSRAAARSIEMLRPGITRVRLEILETPAGATVPDVFAVQVGAFRDRANAERYRAGMEARYGRARILTRDGDSTPWHVLVGTEPTQESARKLAMRLREVEGVGAFLVRVDEP